MSEEKTLEDVIGFLMNVAEFDLAKTKRVPIPGGAMTVVSENYQYMSEVIEWIDNRLKEQKLNENQEIVLEQMKASVQSNEKDIIQAVASIHIRCQLPKYYSKQPYKAYLQLTEKEEAQVLQVFATWALDQC